MATFIIHSSAIRRGEEKAWDKILTRIANTGHQMYFAFPDSDSKSAAEFLKQMGITLSDSIKVKKIFEKDIKDSDDYNSSTTAFVYDLIYEKLESKIKRAKHIYFSPSKQHIADIVNFASSNPTKVKPVVAETKTSLPSREKEDLPTRTFIFNKLL